MNINSIILNHSVFLLLYATILLTVSLTCSHFLFNEKITLFFKKKNETGERFACQTKPITGGIIFMSCFLIGAIVSCVFCTDSISFKENIALILCCTLAFTMGGIDDLRNFSPMFKLIFQILCGVIVIASGNATHTSDNIFLNSALTMLWVVGIMNSINMLDNMDGVTSSISCTILLCLAAIIVMNQQASIFDFIVIISVIISLITFIKWNKYPSEMYMGDNGSQFLGFFLAYYSIKYIWNSNPTHIGFNYEQIIFIALTFLIPITDTITVAVNRFIAGKSPFVGDRYHTTHALVYKGFSIRQVVRTMTAITGFNAIIVWYFISFRQCDMPDIATILLLSYISIIFIIAYLMNLCVRRKDHII